ncbi:MAG TPA: hypothetical protein VM692_04460 [Gammaproteobacteria bacterium]|nr:hypothetical protein [Gammaproteobacteria bacterium]
MAIYVNKNNSFELTEPVARECPHCGTHAQLVPVANPSFQVLAQTRPKHAGLLFRCAACNEPRFLRAAIRAIGAEHVELAPNLTEVERARERFQYNYLPDTVEQLLRETLDCYSLGAHNAFATMCRRTTRAALRTMDADAKTRWHDTLLEVLRVCDVDAVTAGSVETVLFADDGEPPEITADEAAVLVEVLKDLFYQSYVRTSKLRAAMKVRRFFAGESSTAKVTPIDRDGWRELA